MMTSAKKLNLYVETPVFGFYYDEKIENRDKQEKTKLLFEQIQKDYFTALYSDIVLAEIEKLADDFKKHRLLELISRFGLRKIDMPSAEDELLLLSTTLLERQIIPVNKKDDALHLALVILSPQIDYFVTWNCKHLANVNVFRRVKAAVLPLGYELKFEIVTPEEVIFYE